MKKSKAILLALCAVLLVAASVMGTLAYLTSTDSVTNTFTVGNVKITLDETDVDNSTPGAERDKANSYKLLPGHEYEKDPVIHVTAGSSDCYLFVKVDNQIAEIEGGKTVAQQMTANGWATVEGKRGVYVLTYTQDEADKDETGSVTAGALKVVSAATAQVDVPVFEKFKIADDVTDDLLLPSYNGTAPSANVRKLSLFNDAKIIVTAYAVQADGFTGKNAAQIWDAAKFN